MDNNASKAISSAIWKLSERFCAQIITLAVSIVLARLLSPEDYGIVSIVTIFFGFANIIIAGGLTTALVQKHNADELDFSSLFWANLFFSIIIYILFYLCAPAVARIYHIPILSKILRIMGLVLPVYSIQSIYCAYISRQLQFRTFFFATLGGTIISAVVGISLAVKGFGVWALVLQQMTNAIIDTIILVMVTKLKLMFRFSFERFRNLFSFGSKIMFSNFLGQLYVQFTPAVIGIKYNVDDLSFYTKGNMFPSTISSMISSSLSSVLFPFIAKKQNDINAVLNYTRKFMRLASFVVFPALLGFFAISDSFILLLLTEKWLPAAYYMRIFCICVMFDIIAIGNCETIKAIGRSDIYLKIEVVKKVGYFLTLVIFMIFSKDPRQFVLASMVNVVIQVIVNSYPNSKLIGYTYRMQFSDLAINLFNSIVMCVCVFFIGRCMANPLKSMIIQILSGILIYFVLSFIFNRKCLLYIYNLILGFLGRKHNISK